MSTSNLPDFNQLNAPVGQAFGRNESEMAASYQKLGIPLSSSAAQRDMGFGLPLLSNALTFQNQQAFAQAQNQANQGKGTGGFSTGFNGGTGSGSFGGFNVG